MDEDLVMPDKNKTIKEVETTIPITTDKKLKQHIIKIKIILIINIEFNLIIK